MNFRRFIGDKKPDRKDRGFGRPSNVSLANHVATGMAAGAGAREGLRSTTIAMSAL